MLNSSYKYLKFQTFAREKYQGWNSSIDHFDPEKEEKGLTLFLLATIPSFLMLSADQFNYIQNDFSRLSGWCV